SHVLSPWHFYLQVNDTRADQLDYLEEELGDFYGSMDNRLACAYEPTADCSNLPGVYVACPVYLERQAKYIRAAILRQVLAGEAPAELAAAAATAAADLPLFELYALDYGMTKYRRLDEFFKLTDDFLSRLQFQAVKCRLAGVAPLSGGQWLPKA